MATSRWASASSALLVLALASFSASAARAGVTCADLQGVYDGQWTNETQISTGAAHIDIQISGAIASATFDMDGLVFGLGDPAPATITGAVAGNQVMVDAVKTPTYGDIAGSVDCSNGALTFTLTNIPTAPINQIAAAGTIFAGNINLTYTITASPGSSDSNGTLTATVPEPGAGLSALAALLCLSGLARRQSHGRSSGAS